jgi:peptidoglycan/LPS O-acetylase OafA/YrhL
LFFGISGYVIAFGFIHGRYRLVASDLAKFYRNRFLRLYPLFLTLSLLAWATMWWTTGVSPITVSDLPSQFLAMQFNQAYVLSGVFWTLGVEFHFYLIAPLLVWPLLSRSAPLLRGALLYGVMAAIYVGLVLGWGVDQRNVLGNLSHFVAGMVACRLVASPQSIRGPIWATLPTAIILLAITNWFYQRNAELYWSAGVMMIDAAIVLFVLAHASLAAHPKLKAHPAYPPLWWLGTLSYGLYAWHGYLIATWPSLIGGSWLSVAALSLVLGYLSYKGIEAPALRQKRHPATVPPVGDVPVAV